MGLSRTLLSAEISWKPLETAKSKGPTLEIYGTATPLLKKKRWYTFECPMLVRGYHPITNMEPDQAPLAGLVYSPPQVDRIWLWVCYTKIPIICPIFYLLKGDYTLNPKPETIYPIFYLLKGDYRAWGCLGFSLYTALLGLTLATWGDGKPLRRRDLT